MKCCLCQRAFNGDREKCFSHAPFTICKICGVKFIEVLFADHHFNEWLDSFLQSRIEKHVPSYDEYYVRYGKIKCPECNGTGFIKGKICGRCNWVGTIEE